MLSFLKDPTLDGYAIGGPEYFAAQRSLIRQRPLLESCYDGWYDRLLGDVGSVPPGGDVLELGSGGSYLSERDKSIITSDVVHGVAARTIDARSLPFADGSIRAILATHVFHHIPDADRFLQEAERTLVPGGVLSLIEVAHTPMARLFFRRFHPEPYDDRQEGWAFDQLDSMMDSNQALSWIVFDRDRDRFERLFPSLRIESVEFTPWLGYLLSGGVTMRNLVPRALARPIVGLERWLRPVLPVCALHWHLRIRKIP